MGQDWGGGYVTEVEYISGFYSQLAPSSLAYNALMRNMAPRDPYAAYNWLEIGCGSGLCANTLAAANPQSQFFAFDFNPLHILSAQRYAAEAHIQNVRFYEASFEEMLGQDLPQMDYIVMHGIYSWVSDEHREQIHALLGKFLKPGGIVYISYNTLPGWSGKAPLQYLISAYAQSRGGSAVERIAGARERIKQLADAKFRYFGAQPGAVQQLEGFSKHDVRYLVHEYLNQQWHPFYHRQVAERLGTVKLTYAASATLIENVDEATLDADARIVVQAEADPVMRELLRDYATNQEFRRDIFVRGLLHCNQAEQQLQAQQWRFCLSMPRSKCAMEATFPVGKVALKTDTYVPLFDALEEGPQTLAMLSQRSRMTFSDTIKAMGVLYALGYAHPFHESGAAAVASAAAYNRAALLKTVNGDVQTVLVAPHLGTALAFSAVLQYFLYAYLQQAPDLSRYVMEMLRVKGQRLTEHGVTLTDEEELQKVRQREKDFLDELVPLYRLWGVL